MITNEKFRVKRAALGYSQSAISKLGGWNIRTVGRWERDEQEVPASVLLLLDLLEAVRGVIPPPHGSHPAHGRDEPCCQAIAPHLDLMAKRARAVGWIEPEIASAVLSWAVNMRKEFTMPKHSVSEAYILGLTSARRILNLIPNMTVGEMQTQLDNDLRLLAKFTNNGFPPFELDYLKGLCGFWRLQLELATNNPTPTIYTQAK